MQIRAFTRLWILVCVSFVAAPVAAQDMVISNARIIVGNGPVIESGTLGKLADIIAFPASRLDGYWNMLNAVVVIKDGEIVVDKRARRR